MENTTNFNSTAAGFQTQEVPVFYAISYGIVFPTICIVGIIGNILTLIVVNKDRTSTSASRLISCLSASDMFVLVSRFIYVLFRMSEVYLPVRTQVISRYVPSYALLTTTNYIQKVSKMILVQIGMERIMAVWFPLKTKLFCDVKRTQVIVISLVLVVSAISLPCIADILITYTKIISEGGKVYTGMSATINELLRYYRNANKGFITIFLVSRYLFDFFPLFFLAVSSCIIVIGIKRSAKDIRKDGRSNQSKQITKMLVSVCVVFVILCLPSDFLSVALNGYGVTIPSSYYILFDIMTTSNNAINFVFYCAFHKTYRQQYKQIVLCKRTT